MSSISEIKLNENLTALNECFLESHRLRKRQASLQVEAEVPVILVNGDNLTLRKGKERKLFPYISPLYHHLKTIAHVACGIYNIDFVSSTGHLKVECIGKKKQYLERLQNVITDLTDAPEEHPLKLHLDVLKKIQGIISNNEKIEEKANELYPSIESLIDGAAQSRLENLKRVVKEIKIELGETAWAKLAVIVMGPQLPREGDVAMQYFSSIMDIDANKKGKCPFRKKEMLQKKLVLNSQRLIYAESIWSEEGALDLLATHIADEDLGKIFLNDADAMHKDVLASAAARWLLSDRESI